MWLLFIKDGPNGLHIYLGTDDNDSHKRLENILCRDFNFESRGNSKIVPEISTIPICNFTSKIIYDPIAILLLYKYSKKSPLYYFQLIVLFWWYSSKKEHLVKCMAAAWYTRGTNRNVAFFAKTVTLSGDTSDWMWIIRAPYKGIPRCVVFVPDEGDSVVGFCGVW